MSWNKYALDSSALLTIPYQEPGAELVQSMLSRSVISSVNLAECIGKMIARGLPPEESAEILAGMVTEIIPFDRDMALLTARLIPLSKKFGLSLGDRACLATAVALGLEAVTADKIWAKIGGSVKIRVIR